ncbi:MAG: hypothetical protein KC944_17295 [Candidatus Omnitrophica bacterium]|nr:hypothetical protein [Candidatus Omnitrophota bacterium]
MPQLEEPATAIMMDPVFAPANMANMYHMTPRFFYDGRILKPGDFDFDFAVGTAGTDFDLLREGVRLKEDSEISYYTDFGYRFGLFEILGPLSIPSEIYTQLPVLFGDHKMSSELPIVGAKGGKFPVDDVDESFAFGKWVWGLRFGLFSETGWTPRTVLGGSIGLPIDDSIASDSTDFDLRLTFEKHLGSFLIGNLYGGYLFPGDGKEVLTDAGANEDGNVPYAGLLFQTDLSHLTGRDVWLHFGGSWRDALYDFGHIGPDYGEEEVRATVGLTFDMGWWGCTAGRPQGMIGMDYNVAGGPEEGEIELVTRFRFPYWTGKHWPCN